MGNRDISKICINFEELRCGRLDESIFNFLSFWVGQTLKVLLGDISLALPVKIKGTPAEVKSFVNTLSKEKSYVEAYRQYGLDDPKTFRSKSRVRTAVFDFERKTGLKWPFQH